VSTLQIAADATVGDLRAAIAPAIEVSSQESAWVLCIEGQNRTSDSPLRALVKSGFPPKVLTNSGGGHVDGQSRNLSAILSVSFVLGEADNVILILLDALPISTFGIGHGESLVVTRNPSALTAAAASATTTTTLPSIPPVVPPTRSAQHPGYSPVRSLPKPASHAREANLKSVDGTSIPMDGAHLTLRVVPDDNECLFHAVGIAFEQCREGAATRMRKGLFVFPRGCPRRLM
jgi:hypothetical protein